MLTAWYRKSFLIVNLTGIKYTTLLNKSEQNILRDEFWYALRTRTQFHWNRFWLLACFLKINRKNCLYIGYSWVHQEAIPYYFEARFVTPPCEKAFVLFKSFVGVSSIPGRIRFGYLALCEKWYLLYSMIIWVSQVNVIDMFSCSIWLAPSRSEDILI